MSKERNWQIEWAQGLLILAGAKLEWEVLEDGLTQEEAQEEKLQEWKRDLADADGVIVRARKTPEEKPATRDDTIGIHTCHVDCPCQRGERPVGDFEGE